MINGPISAPDIIKLKDGTFILFGMKHGSSSLKEVHPGNIYSEANDFELDDIESEIKKSHRKIWIHRPDVMETAHNAIMTNYLNHAIDVNYAGGNNPAEDGIVDLNDYFEWGWGLRDIDDNINEGHCRQEWRLNMFNWWDKNSYICSLRDLDYLSFEIFGETVHLNHNDDYSQPIKERYSFENYEEKIREKHPEWYEKHKILDRLPYTIPILEGNKYEI